MDGITVAPVTAPEIAKQDYAYDAVHPIAGLLGLDVHGLSETDSKSLQAIYEFARGDAAEMTELELLSKVRSIEQRLGLTALGERRIDKVYRYVKLQSQIDGLTQARDRELR